MRLFFAIDLPAEVRATLGRLRLPDAAANDDYRWVDPSLLHITLAFLGEQPRTLLERLGQVGRDTAAAWRGGRVAITAHERGSFGPRRAPRVLWVSLGGDVERLVALQADLATGLRRAGFTIEDRPFSPHITLARRRDGRPAAAAPAWPPESPARPGAVLVDSFSLLESHPGGRPRYTTVARFPLAGLSGPAGTIDLSGEGSV